MMREKRKAIEKNVNALYVTLGNDFCPLSENYSDVIYLVPRRHCPGVTSLLMTTGALPDDPAIRDSSVNTAAAMLSPRVL
jgi:hypothetical protein